MKKIDSHQHFWKYQPVKDAWISDDMKTIQRDFLPEDLKPLLTENGVDSCIAVQADQSEEETQFLLELTQSNDFILGVVGWVDLQNENLKSRLDYFSQFKKLKGFRHIVQEESDDNFLLNENFCRGISQLEPYNFTYDILILPKHLAVAFEFIKRFPNQKFIIDHLAKPDFIQADFTTWKQGISAIASCPNVYCKVSGLVTQADWNHWSERDFEYCLDVVTEAFGMDKILYGSDWPVCLLAANYQETVAIATNYIAAFSLEEQEKFWSKNAIDFYNL
ncbi:amidohydrolase family protein [Flavobacterium sp.]|uniref:amidohydrolase family protein n=1 Tax=Flavobacterium sp. TaxID=239 RepID=UPI00286BA83C|nr:amidohydrolase family protein [Flavobacterium sp.]